MIEGTKIWALFWINLSPSLKYLTKSSQTGQLYYIIYDIKSHGWFPYMCRNMKDIIIARLEIPSWKSQDHVLSIRSPWFEKLISVRRSSHTISYIVSSGWQIEVYCRNFIARWPLRVPSRWKKIHPTVPAINHRSTLDARSKALNFHARLNVYTRTPPLERCR